VTAFWVAVVGALVAILLGIDVFCKLTGRKTLSRVVHDAASEWPIISFILGVIVGGLAWHFFVPGGCY
jgi:uncharacterized integral membrane protein